MVGTPKIGKIILEPLRLDHAHATFDAWQDERLYTYLPSNPPASPEALEKKYARRLVGHSDDGTEQWLNWFMHDQSRGAYVGRLEATVLPDRTASIGYLVFPKYWRMGYARKGCTTMIETLFADYDVRSIIAVIDARNEGSIGLVARLGFEHVGTELRADNFKGAWSDEHRYQLDRAASRQSGKDC